MPHVEKKRNKSTDSEQAANRSRIEITTQQHAKSPIEGTGIPQEGGNLVHGSKLPTSVVTKDRTSHRQFLEKLLDTFNNRRTAVDSRATIICTVGLAFFGFLLTQSKEIFNGLSTFKVSLFVTLVLIPLVVSVIYSLSLIAPLRRPRKKRINEEKTLTWFFHIPQQTLAEYQENIMGLTESQLVEQTAKQVYELSVLLRTRYCRLIYSCWYLGISIILFTILLIGNYIWQYFLRGI